MPSVKKVKLISSSDNQVALCHSLEEVIHVAWYFQPTFLAVWAIAHAYATFVAARIGIVGAVHSDHVGSVETSTAHRRAVARCTQSSAALPLLPYHHGARAVGEGSIGHLADGSFRMRDSDLRQVLHAITPLDTLHLDVANGEELKL